MTTAIVVGSGPNGLAAAVTLARLGVEVTVLEAAATIGGGTRTSELTIPGLLHDHCSAIHPGSMASPFMRALDLQAHGLVWRWPEIDIAHPVGGGRAGAAVSRSVTATGDLLGADGPAWRNLFGPLTDDVEALADDLLRPAIHVPRHPLALGRIGLRAAAPPAVLARRWRTDEARGLFAGVAAHAFQPFHRPAPSAIGLLLMAMAHRYGWPVAQGGSQAITTAMASVLGAHGGRIETDVTVRSLAELPPTDLVLLDISPRGAVSLAGDRLPPRVRRAYERYRFGPGAFKLDLAVEGGVPWLDQHSRRAGTVHVCGTLAEVAGAERAISQGRMPERPFVIVGQQYLADPTRSAGDVHPVWTYAHVPNGYAGDATGAIIRQIERFAPGLRDRIVATSARATTAIPDYNPNFVGGDINTGANTEKQLLFRPRWALDPYRTGIPGVFLCSAATPPGAGVHGLCGYYAAKSAVRHLTRRRG